MEEFVFYFQKLCRTSNIRALLVSGMLASLVLMFHTLTLSSRKALPHVLPNAESFSAQQSDRSSSEYKTVGKFSLLSDPGNASLVVAKELVEATLYDVKSRSDVESRPDGIGEDVGGGDEPYEDLDVADDDGPDEEFSFSDGNAAMLKKIGDQEGQGSQEKLGEAGTSILDGGEDFPFLSMFPRQTSPPSGSHSTSLPMPEMQGAHSANVVIVNSTDPSFLELTAIETHNKSASSGISDSDLATVTHNATLLHKIPVMKRRAFPPTSVQEMTNSLIRNYAAYHSMRPRWSSPRDRELLAVKAQIENAPIVRHDDQLHAPAFRNISKFKRSYQLMERTLKVFVYRDGNKPVFHQPILKGIYSSEGWFMKLMEGSKRFVVRDPRRAHLFYMPFSSRHLQFAVYVRGSHNRTTLRAYLRKYVDSIAAKYPFWNRTDGSDHFLVACHDWAPYETRHVMDRSFRALCNADLANAFKLGKDVSLPETYVRSAREPQRDLGGRPADQRPTLAFYAGNMHGYLRPFLLQHWENRDPDMKIFGPMPRGVQSKMTYIEHMKSSKFCVCPRGYEVNSPRIVEALFYECVPVIISDGYVPPFFEVLDWEAFAVFVPERDIPRLKEILTAISEEKYRALQAGVRRVQQHFLWHSVPVKYDLFHMTLHSIWYNRVLNVRPR